MLPDVSVIIPCFNRKKYLRSAVESVLREDLNAEIIVVDDCSTDGSAAMVRDLPVTLLTTPRNLGQSYATNFGVIRARSDLLSFLDSDDLLVPGSLEWRVDCLRSNSSDRIVVGNAAEILAADDMVIRSFPKYKTESELLTFEDIRKGKRGIEGGLFYSVVRKELWQKLGGLDESLPFAEEWDFFFRAIKETPVRFFDRGVVRYRVHGENKSLDRSNKGTHGNSSAIAWMVLVFISHGLDPFSLWSRRGTIEGVAT